MVNDPWQRRTRQWVSDRYPISTMSPFDYIELCGQAADAAIYSIKDLIGTDEAFRIVYTGADGTPTRLIDDISEKAILDILKGDGRSMRILSEECGEILLGDSPEFAIILDPLDGTYNAAHDIPFYSISIAIGSPDLSEIWFGYVRNLANGDTYHAELGKGAYLNGKTIGPSANSTLKDFCISIYGYRRHVERTIKLSKSIRRIRILGSVALELCYVASGKLDAFVDIRRSLRLVDVAAGKLILEEAGGIVTDGDGRPLELDDSVINRLSMIASNEQGHPDILYLTKRCT